MTWDRNRTLMVAAGATLVVAGIAYRALSGRETVSPGEVIAQLGDLNYYVRCEACGQTYTMLAAEFTRAAASTRGTDGIKCIRCGQRKAWRVEAPVEGNPLLVGFDAKRYTTMGDVLGAIDDLNVQIAAVQTELVDEKDKARTAALERDLHLLYLKRSALDARVDELGSQATSP